jgi:hypothetical protein
MATGAICWMKIMRAFYKQYCCKMRQKLFQQSPAVPVQSPSSRKNGISQITVSRHDRRHKLALKQVKTAAYVT